MLRDSATGFTGETCLAFLTSRFRATAPLFLYTGVSGTATTATSSGGPPQTVNDGRERFMATSRGTHPRSKDWLHQVGVFAQSGNALFGDETGAPGKKWRTRRLTGSVEQNSSVS